MKPLLILFLSFFALNAFSQTSEQRREARAIKDLTKTTLNLAQADLSCKKNTDCIVVEYGSMPCGGPMGGIILSEKNLNAAEVQFLAKRTFQKEEAYNKKWQVFGICIAPIMPEPKCVAGLCQDLKSW